MGNKRQKAAWAIAAFFLILIFLAPVFSSDYQRFAIDFISRHPMAAPLTIVIGRFLAIVVAPLPGMPIAFASLAVLPWQEAWLYNFLGADLGAFAAFMIARKFREPVAARFTGLRDLHAWEAAIAPRRKFWGFLALRFLAASALDFFSYAAGLSKVSFRTFALATVLADIPITFAFFYFGGMAMRFGTYIFFGFMAMFAIASAVITRYHGMKNGNDA